MKCDICGIREAITSYIEEKNNFKKMIHVCEECFQKQENQQELKCDACGKSYRDFLATGEFGCKNCYRVFKAQTIKILEDKIERGKKRITREVKTTVPKTHINKSTKKARLKDLEDLLELAYKENDRDKIVKIEDEIKRIKNLEIEKY